jgi:exodeoxyribonuclease V alpha subunit
MTAMDRIEAAARQASAVVAADGLLAMFNDAGVLDPLDVLAASTIGRICGEEDQAVLLAAALAVRGTRFGHVCIRLADVRQGVAVDGRDPKEVDALPWPDPAGWHDTVAPSPLVGDGSGEEPLVVDGDRLYLERYYRYEQRFAELVMERFGDAREASPAELAMLDSLLDRDPHGDRTRQHAAAVTALESRIAVIAGGPGTGKTYTVGALVAALAADGPDRFPLTALCAPTGKAAARLGEAIAELIGRISDPTVRSLVGEVTPSTIHRLLGSTWGRGRFVHDDRNRLPHDLVIVDEMSMVSLPLAAKLLSAVRDDATVVMVGDPDQLESIEAGTVLADVVTGAEGGGAIADHVVVLDRVHRFAETGVIADFADAVRTGDADAALELLQGGHDELAWARERGDPAFDRLWGEVVSQRSRLVDLARQPGEAAATLAALRRLAVLCARRTGRDGVSRWTVDIENALDERYTGLRWQGEWYPGRPVMITNNDYLRDLYNGDIGVCVDSDDGPRAVFERGGGVRSFPRSHLGEHTTFHATTIHKSQGSQFDRVAVVLPQETSRLLTRELLYTAVTRARHGLTVVGDEAVVRAAIERSVQRASGLAARLRSAG